jgi:hypothetical protein
MKRLNKVLISVLVFVSRFGYLPPNLTPVGSLGFFGSNFWLYMAVIVGFDVIKGGFYSGFLFTYLGFISYYLFGRHAKTNRQKLVFLPLASLTFFLVSNFGVWWYWYPRTIDDLMRCYVLAIPFYRNTLLGDVLFGYGIILYQSGVVKRFFESKITRSNYI